MNAMDSAALCSGYLLRPVEMFSKRSFIDFFSMELSLKAMTSPDEEAWTRWKTSPRVKITHI